MTLDTPTRPQDTPTLSFEAFWNWLVGHPNCILRAGTPDSVLYDDDDLHWSFATEGTETVLAQLVHGKRLIGEVLVQPELVAYVQGYEGDQEGEYVFELISENERERVAAYFFVLSHAYEDPPEELAPGRAVH